MNWFEKILYFLNNLTMLTPTRWGWFHIMWIIIIIICIILSFIFKNKYNEKSLKFVLILYGVVTFILELIKQLMWSFNYESGVVTWSYTWYSFPFQLCTTPLFVSLIAIFLRKNKLRDSLISYLSFYTTIISLLTIIIPDSCFTSQVMINIHTMYLHCMAFALSMYLIINKEVKLTKENLFNAFKIFIIFVSIALIMDIIIYNSGILNGSEFNMFYISPYFECILPVFSIIYNKVPYLVFLLIYILSIFSCSLIIYFIIKLLNSKKISIYNLKKLKKSV